LTIGSVIRAPAYPNHSLTGSHLDSYNPMIIHIHLPLKLHLMQCFDSKKTMCVVWTLECKNAGTYSWPKLCYYKNAPKQPDIWL